MKSLFKLKLFGILFLSILLINCEKSHIDEPRKNSELSSEEITSISKATQQSETCYGWAVRWTGLDQYPLDIMSVPEKEFSLTSDPSEAIIIEWRGDNGSHDHAAKILYYYEYSGDVKVKEYAQSFHPHTQINTYSYPYDHPLSADDNVFWWKKDPPSLSVNISGPTELHNGEIGVFTATPKGGAGTYNNYRWWKRNDEYPKGKIETKAPPPGEWIELTEWEGEKTIRQTAHHDFSLKCRVYDVWGKTAQDIHSVLYIQ